MRENAQSNQNMNRAGMNPAMMRQMQNGVMNGNINKQMYVSCSPHNPDSLANRDAQDTPTNAATCADKEGTTNGNATTNAAR